MITDQTRIIDVTIGELVSYINDKIKVTHQEIEKETEIEDVFIHGIKAFAIRYSFSLSKAHRLRHSKKLEDYVVTTPRSVKFKKKECDELYRKGLLF